MNYSDAHSKASRGRRFRPALILVPAALALACLLAGSSARAQQPARARYEIKIATLAPDGSTWMNLMNQLDAEVRRQTQGAVGFRWYPGGIQGDESIVLRKIRSGQLQGGGLTGVGLGQLDPSLRVLELPFLFRNEDEVHAVHEKVDPLLEKRMHDAGFTILGWADVGFVYLYSKKPVTTVKDLQDQKVWLWEGDPLAETFLKTAGVSPVPLAITDVLTSLQTGLVTTVYITPLANNVMQWFTRISYTTDVPLTFSLGAVVVTNAAFDAIPPQYQQIVRECSSRFFAQLRASTSEDNKKSMEIISQNGVKTVSPSEADRQSFLKIGEQVREELVGKLYDRPILDSVLQALADYRQGKGANPDPGAAEKGKPSGGTAK
jgi:TRAP-type transport system periplasmic protein